MKQELSPFNRFRANSGIAEETRIYRQRKSISLANKEIKSGEVI